MSKFTVLSVLFVLNIFLSACSPSEQVEQAGQAGDTELSPFKSTGDVLHIMQWVLDPASDHVWDSAGSIITAAGTRELAPTTDEGWLAVQHSAAVVAATGNLLLMPERVVDEAGWRDMSLGLIAAGTRAQAAAAAQDSDELFKAGGQIYRVCASCHAVYLHDDEDEQNSENTDS